MTSPIKLIALDLDGTLLGADHDTIPQRNLDALREASRRGVKIAIASGRSWSLIHETSEALGVTDFGVTANGGCVVDVHTGAVRVKTPMDRAQCAAIIRILRRRGLPYELYVDGKNYVQRSDLPGLERFSLSSKFMQMFLRNMTVVEDMLELTARTDPEKFDVFYVPPEERDDAAREVASTGPLAITGALVSNLEITAAGVHKGSALEALTRQLGITAENVMAFGDADNDLEMLSWAGWGFAMGNATDAARRAARYQTASNDQAGVGQAVEAYVLKN